jgi:raffinose/stachyose/melibiose transport system substrate-binding protein
LLSAENKAKKAEENCQTAKIREGNMSAFSNWLRAASVAAVLSGGAAVAQAQEIKFWTLSFDNPKVAEAYQSIIKDFQAANPGVTVKLENRGTDEHKTALRVAGASDQAPDIYFMWAGLGLGGEFIKSGLAAPMDKYYTQYKWDDEFIAPALSFSKQYSGGRFGLPSTFRGEAIYYNKALFQKAGITSEPKTYEEFLAAAEKLAAAKIPAFTFGGTVNWHVMRLMDEVLEIKCGPEKHDALMSMKVSWADEPCATQSFEEFHKWTSKYFLKPFMGIDQGQSFNLFLAGRAAMMLEGNWLVGQLRNANKLADYGVFPFPGATRLYGFGEYNYISTKSKNPDIAAKFLDYLESTPVQEANLAVFGGSTNKNAKSTSTEPLDLAWTKIFGQFDSVFVNGDQAFPLDVTTEYFRVINEVAGDSLDPKNAAGELQKFIAARK